VSLGAGGSATGRDLANVLVSQVTPVEVARVIHPPSPDAATAFVQGLYHNLLARDGEASGVAFWVQRLAAVGSREQIVAEFWLQPEHREVQVKHYYRTYLDREFDPQGLADHVQDFVARGFSEADVVLTFIFSNEYQARYAGDAAFIQALYDDGLSRQAEAAGEAFWLQQLAAQGRRAVAHLILTSDESFLRIIDAYYAVFLHRAPEVVGGIPTGRVAWFNRLQLGRLSAAQVGNNVLQAGPNSPGAVGELFLALPEYFTNAQAATTTS
jgi:hypothetical protein